MQSATAKKREERRTRKAIEQNREKEEYETDGINNALPRWNLVRSTKKHEAYISSLILNNHKVSVFWW